MDAWYADILQCPDCGESLDKNRHYACKSCGFIPGNDKRILDFRPRGSVRCTVHYCWRTDRKPSEYLKRINIERPEIIYDGPLGKRDSSELLSEILCYVKKGSGILDLGCGPRDQALPLEYLGYRYVGIDYNNESADFLADAHAIPFKKASFDVVFSYAVMEHLHNPFVAISEVARVLRPGGIYIGTVSQGEPFHDSFFHSTAWGMTSLAASIPELEIRRLWATGDTLFSLARMGRYPKIIRFFLKIVALIDFRFPWLAPNRHRSPDRTKKLEALYRAGSIGFVIQKLQVK